MSQSNGGGDRLFTAMFVFFVASVLVTLLTGMWLHWLGVLGAFVVAGHVADSASKRRIRGDRKRR